MPVLAALDESTAKPSVADGLAVNGQEYIPIVEVVPKPCFRDLNSRNTAGMSSTQNSVDGRFLKIVGYKAEGP